MPLPAIPLRAFQHRSIGLIADLPSHMFLISLIDHGITFVDPLIDNEIARSPVSPSFGNELHELPWVATADQVSQRLDYLRYLRPSPSFSPQNLIDYLRGSSKNGVSKTRVSGHLASSVSGPVRLGFYAIDASFSGVHPSSSFRRAPRIRVHEVAAMPRGINMQYYAAHPQTRQWKHHHRQSQTLLWTNKPRYHPLNRMGSKLMVSFESFFSSRSRRSALKFATGSQGVLQDQPVYAFPFFRSTF